VPYFDVAVLVDGKCVLRYNGGFTDLEKTRPVTGKERYNIYSCSKPITVTAAMQLWEKGLFNLEDPLANYMPEFSEMTVKTETGIRKAEKPILVRYLFEMTAGFSYNCSSPELKKAYDEKNMAELLNICDNVLPELRKRVEEFTKVYRDLWYYAYKGFGFEVIDGRLGAVIANIETTKYRLKQFINGEAAFIEELEEKRLPLHGREGPINYMNFYGQIVSPSRICPEA
jgi:hypothetical protein